MCCMCVFSAMRFGRVDTLGQYISEFDPEPDSGKKGIGQLVVTSTDLYKYSPEAVLPIHAVSYHVATDKPPPKMATSSGLFLLFSDNLQPVATRGKKACGTLLASQHCGNGCSIKRAPLSVSYYNKISGGHIGWGVVRRRCSAGPVLPLWSHLCY